MVAKNAAVTVSAPPTRHVIHRAATFAQGCNFILYGSENGCVLESDGLAAVGSTGKAHAACRTPDQARTIKLTDDHEAMQIAPTGGIAAGKKRSHNVRGFRGEVRTSAPRPRLGASEH